MDESELRRCIRHHVRQASRGGDSDSSNDAENDVSEAGGEEDFESNMEYQELVKQVEEKLIEFLEGQVKLTDYSENNAATPSVDPNAGLPIHQAHAYPCSDTFKALPSPPEDWPQRYDDP